jgi:ADP-heptose:LPS heptosyltransferase
MRELIKKDLANWKKDAPKYKYKQRIFISVSGGIGDQINAQPAIRFMREKVLPEAEIIVATHYPRLFRDIVGIKVFEQGKFVTKQDTPYRVIDSFPPPSSVTYSVVGNLLCHTVDFCSIALLKRTLPFSEKNIKLNVSLKDIQRVIDIVGIRDLRELVVIHPGKHWESKTMPYKWWEEIIEVLLKEKIPVCIIGKTGEPGVWNFEDKKEIINLVDLLDLDMLIALLSQAKVLVSNDSSPIHIAGAFDNWIIVIPSVKHPDHVLPFRNGSVYYKADALCKRLVLDDYSTSPFEINEIAAAKMIGIWDNYLVDSKEVIETIKKRYLSCL